MSSTLNRIFLATFLVNGRGRDFFARYLQSPPFDIVQPHARSHNREQCIRVPPMGVTGTWLKFPERALNIICISLKFLGGGVRSWWKFNQVPVLIIAAMIIHNMIVNPESRL